MPSFAEVTDYLAGFDLRTKAFNEPTPTAPAAAAVVGCSVAEIAKTMLVSISGEPLVVVASGDVRLNNSLLKQACGRSGKVRFCSAEQVDELLGYPPGGVCPFLLPAGLPVLLDTSLQRFEQVYPAAGTPASAVRVPVSLLSELCGGEWSEVCRLEQG